MEKSLYIAEKPSVAAEFAKALKQDTKRKDGYMESDQAVVTWCVGHLVGMSYPEVYDPKLKKWSYDTLPFIPDTFLYEVIPSVKKQFGIVSGLLSRKDITRIYVCTDSGREGEYIYRLVEQMVAKDHPEVLQKDRRRVWIDSQTEEEVLRGIREAKPLSEYDNLAASAYLRAKEDYLMGINFSRALSLKYGNTLAQFLHKKYTVVAVGRVMTCVLGMVVRREREIRNFVKTPFYRILAQVHTENGEFQAEWRAKEGTKYFESPLLYKENGLKKEEDAKALVNELNDPQPVMANVEKKETKTEKKQAPLLFNLAEIQNYCSKNFKISPDETLRIIQELYEKKMVTYPRTDARVLSTAVAKEITKNLKGLLQIHSAAAFAKEILDKEYYKGLAKTKYVNDKMITDHYAIIPTGQGIAGLKSLSQVAVKVYSAIVRRFLAIFYPPAVYKKVSLTLKVKDEYFFASVKALAEPGYQVVFDLSGEQKQENSEGEPGFAELHNIKKNDTLPITSLDIKEGETSPPKRYNSGSLILAMENAGQLIEDEDLRALIKGSGIGTSATRAEILKKLINNGYIQLNKKTQIITPQLLGELVYDVVEASISSLLNPDLTASWEKGLSYVAEGTIPEEEYMQKLDGFVRRRVQKVVGLQNQSFLKQEFNRDAVYYK